MQKPKKIRVLVVDDSKVVLKSVCQILKKLGYETVPAPGGPEALEIMETDDGFNLVMTDINMPQIDGWELALRIMSIKPDIPIIALTGEDPGNVLSSVRGSGINHVLFKPFQLDQLNNAMINIFGLDQDVST